MLLVEVSLAKVVWAVEVATSGVVISVVSFVVVVHIPDESTTRTLTCDCRSFVLLSFDLIQSSNNASL